MAFGNATFADAGGAVQDIFSGISTATQDNIKAQGLAAEGQEYDLAASLAEQNKQFEETSTSLQEAQQQRAVLMGIGKEQTEIAGAGFNQSGSAVDLLAASAQQGALQKATLSQQGLIKEAGYEEQAQSYNIMSATAKQAGTEEAAAGNEAEVFGDITGAIKGAASLATLFA